MRHDAHYVELLAGRRTETVGRQIPIAELRPNPQQPRRSLGDLDELAASIRRVGVLEPLLVRETPEGYQIISGERRYRAARAAGLQQVPCIVLDVGEAEILEIALIENLQRQDLSPFEEAEALRALVERFGYTHEEVAARIGKSRTSVTETLSLMSIPGALRARLEQAGVHSKSVLLEIARQPTDDDRARLVALTLSQGLTRDQLRELRRTVSPDARPATPPPSPRRFTYRSPRGVTVTLYLRRPDLSPDDVDAILRDAAAAFRRQPPER